MATTPNFNWSTPDNTGLVKNGALDIRTLGNSIDASMADLKGGTTGQVLAKATNTDMDFSWVAPASGSSYVAGKNFVINGAMDIWQRGTSGLGTSTGSYTADRWVLGSSSTTVTRDTDVPNSPYFQYSLKMVGTSDNSIIQRVEAANSTLLAGQTVTFSFYAKRTSGTGALDVRFYYPSATDNFASNTQIGSTVVVSASPSSSWTRYSVTAAIGTGITTGLQILINNTGAATTFITGAQLEIASAASAFSRASGNVQAELAACQRYYYRTTATQSYSDFGTGYNTTTNTASIMIPLPVTMRTTPTSVETTGTATDYNILHSSGGAAARTVCNNVPIYQVATPTMGRVNFQVASGLTAGNGSVGGSNNNTTAYLGWSAEL